MRMFISLNNIDKHVILVIIYQKDASIFLVRLYPDQEAFLGIISPAIIQLSE